MPEIGDDIRRYFEITRNFQIRQPEIGEHFKATFWRWSQNMYVLVQLLRQVIAFRLNLRRERPPAGAKLPHNIPMVVFLGHTESFIPNNVKHKRYSPDNKIITPPIDADQSGLEIAFLWQNRADLTPEIGSIVPPARDRLFNRTHKLTGINLDGLQRS